MILCCRTAASLPELSLCRTSLPAVTIVNLCLYFWFQNFDLVLFGIFINIISNIIRAFLTFVKNNKVKINSFIWTSSRFWWMPARYDLFGFTKCTYLILISFWTFSFINNGNIFLFFWAARWLWDYNNQESYIIILLFLMLWLVLWI